MTAEHSLRMTMMRSRCVTRRFQLRVCKKRKRNKKKCQVAEVLSDVRMGRLTALRSQRGSWRGTFCDDLLHEQLLGRSGSKLKEPHPSRLGVNALPMLFRSSPIKIHSPLSSQWMESGRTTPSPGSSACTLLDQKAGGSHLQRGGWTSSHQHHAPGFGHVVASRGRCQAARSRRGWSAPVRGDGNLLWTQRWLGFCHANGQPSPKRKDLPRTGWPTGQSHVESVDGGQERPGLS